MEKSISSRSDSAGVASARNTLQIMEVVDYRVTAPKTKIIELITTDSLIALLPKNACYMASSNGMAVMLKRTPEGEIQATAASMDRDSTSARLEVVCAAESEQHAETFENNVTTEDTHHARDQTVPWAWLEVILFASLIIGFLGWCLVRGGNTPSPKD